MTLHARVGLFLLGLLLLPAGALAHDALRVRWEPRAPRQGDPVVIFAAGLPRVKSVEGALGAQTLVFFPYGDGYAAVAGVDLETRPGRLVWRISVTDGRGNPMRASGALPVRAREFPIQRLTLPKAMVDLDAPTLARVEEEARRLRTLYATVTPERFWRGRFTKPVGVSDPGEGFGARRIINGQPRAPHSGVDYSADAGTQVVAANAGRVALVAEYFFPGRLVVLDHGLGLFTLYFHLERVEVQERERVERGQPIGAVGATGRASGPHLHFGAHLSQARIDPTALLILPLSD
ncbi:MAG: M23 family metallopeptidase [Candidatus Rokubacteria bacterium]|nr:M23 family metallopeptidase [Candidatus Rokubacteria bacterium]